MRLGDMAGHPAYKLLGADGKVVTVQDFETLVEFLEDPYGYLDSSPPFSVLAGLLRGSRAIDFDRFNAFATCKLQQIWPHELEQISHVRLQHASESVVLARRWGIPELLKRSFYELVRSGGLGQSVDEDEDEDDDSSTEETEEDRNTIISRKDLVRLIDTREKLHLDWLLCADLPPSSAAYPCSLAVPAPTLEPRSLIDNAEDNSAKMCSDARDNWLWHWVEEVEQSGIYEDHMYDPLCGLDKLAEIDWAAKGLCEGCVESERTAWLKKKEKIWKNLELWLKLLKIPESGAANGA